MLLDINGQKYALHFAHRWNYEADIQLMHWATYCGLHEGVCKVKGCAELVHPYQGVAYCHSNDQFERKIGRKISLGRALQALPRSLRQQIWENYFKLCPHK